jgi:hypothetical protein
MDKLTCFIKRRECERRCAGTQEEPFTSFTEFVHYILTSGISDCRLMEWREDAGRYIEVGGEA